MQDGWFVVERMFLMSDVFSPCRDSGHEGLDSELSGEEGGGLRPGETRPAQRPQEPRLYPFALEQVMALAVTTLNSLLSAVFFEKRVSECVCVMLC